MNKCVKEIMTLINNQGYQIYIVGGYVRDYLLNNKSKDYDLCTNANIDILKEILKSYDYDIKLNTLCININDISIEITPFRKEIEYYNRRPIKFELVDNLVEDLYRRDFTINSICMDVNGNIIDLLDGRTDLENKLIKCIGDNRKKIMEDPLRILRALRFSATLNFSIDEDLMNTIIDNKELLKELSYERKKLEIEKLIRIKRLDVLKEMSDSLEINLSSIKYYNDDILTWLSIDKFNKYCITKYERNTINNIRKLYEDGINSYNIYKYGQYISELSGEYYNIDTRTMYRKLPIKNRKDIKITSQDIMNITGGKLYIESIYRQLEKAIINNVINNIYDEIVNYIRNNMFKK